MKPVILGVTTRLLAKQARHLERLVRDDDDFRLKGWAAPLRPGLTESGTKATSSRIRSVAQWTVPRRMFSCSCGPWNGGRSEAGKRFREMEAYCETNPGTFCFNRPIYDDQTARPAFLEFGLLKVGGELWMERFANR